MNDIEMLLEALHQSPFDQVTYLALADAYEMVGEMKEAVFYRDLVNDVQPLRRRMLISLIWAQTNRLAMPIALSLSKLTEGDVALVFLAGATGEMRGKTCQLKPKSVLARMEGMITNLTTGAGVTQGGAYFGGHEFSYTFIFQEGRYEVHNLRNDAVTVDWDNIPDEVLLAGALRRCISMAWTAQRLANPLGVNPHICDDTEKPWGVKTRAD